MPHVSRRRLDPKFEQELVGTLLAVLAKVSKKKDMQVFLSLLLSSTEHVMLAKRLAIFLFLQEGVADSRITSTLNVTRETVARMRLLQEARGRMGAVIDDIVRREHNARVMRKTLLKLAQDVAQYSVRAAGGRVTIPKEMRL